TTFTVRFAPTSIGTKTGVLHIANNDADENPFNISLTGICPLVTEAWVQRYNAISYDYATAVVVDASGNVVVTGDPATIKYLAGGTAGWTNLGGTALAVDGSGNVVVIGLSGEDYDTAKYAAADGTLLWEKRYNGPRLYNSSAMAVAVD